MDIVERLQRCDERFFSRDEACVIRMLKLLYGVPLKSKRKGQGAGADGGAEGDELIVKAEEATKEQER